MRGGEPPGGVAALTNGFGSKDKGMRRFGTGAVLALALMIGGCGGGSEESGNASEALPANETVATAEAEPALPPCPFQETSDWNASITGGELLVNGQVDLLMAGFKPTLTPRQSSPGAFAFDLALVPEAGAAVDDLARYEASVAERHRRAEIWCGGEKIADVDVVLVG